MPTKWFAVVFVVASVMPANADSKGAATAGAKASLPSEFYLVTRQCKQLVAEIGSSNEATQTDLVGVASASDYISVCTRPDREQDIVRCISRLKGKDQIFVSSGSRDIETLFMVVVNKPPLVLLQDATGENAMYINVQSRDAVLTSRQYFELGSGHNGKALAANNKFCKAMLLNEADVKKLAKTK